MAPELIKLGKIDFVGYWIKYYVFMFRRKKYIVMIGVKTYVLERRNISSKDEYLINNWFNKK